MLRVLTDETVSHSFSTIESMVLDAVRGKPTTAPSRTALFKSGKRAQTPGPSGDGDSSSEETGTQTNVESDAVDITGLGDPSSESSCFEESESAGEMALISESFKHITATTTGPTIPLGTGPEGMTLGVESPGCYSSGS